MGSVQCPHVESSQLHCNNWNVDLTLVQGATFRALHPIIWQRNFIPP